MAHRFADLIQGMASKLTNSYSLSPEDRDDLVAAVHLKLAAVPWYRKRRESGKPLQAYAKSVILNAFRDEVHRLCRHGFGGLTAHGKDHPMSCLPRRDPLDAVNEVGKDGTEGRFAVQEMLGRLSEDERVAIELSFGFDSGGNRTIIQVAREMGVSRKEAEALVASGLKRLKNVVR